MLLIVSHLNNFQINIRKAVNMAPKIILSNKNILVTMKINNPVREGEGVGNQSTHLFSIFMNWIFTEI